MATRGIHIEPDKTIGDLVGRLAEDSKRLLQDEVQLAKIETKQAVRTATRGAVWLALAFGLGVIALTTLTILLCVAFARLTGELWLGTLITAALELLVGAAIAWLGWKRLSTTDYKLDDTRASVKETARWVRTEKEQTREWVDAERREVARALDPDRNPSLPG